MKYLSIVLTLLVAFSLPNADARDSIKIVGSSTVYPFATVVAEEFGRADNGFKAPIIESTGSGGGLKLFCAGKGPGTPDVTNASRRIKSKEVKLCAKNGIIDITEMKIGFDGIVVANAKDGATLSLTRKDLYLALAAEVPCGIQDGVTCTNEYKTWNQVRSDLPNMPIVVYGPPPTSGTRDAFAEIALSGGCNEIPWIKKLKKKDKKAWKKLCRTVREDGPYIEAGENDNLIIQKLTANKDSFGIFGFSFLDQNKDKVKGSVIDGVAPTFDAIASGDYKVSRSLYFYVKNDHVGVIPGVQEYMEFFMSDDAIGSDGYLLDKGLIPLPESSRAKYQADAKSLSKLVLN
jgi:phosphate transport system substrate-binding protein